MSKTVFFSCLLIFCIFFRSEAQLIPTEEKALITFRLYHPDTEKPWPNLGIKITGKKSPAGIEIFTNEKGEASALFLINDVYTLHLQNLPNFGSIEIGSGAFQKHYIPIPYDGTKISKSPAATDKKTVMLRLQLNNKEGQALTHPEQMTIVEQKSGKQFHVSSDKHGRAALTLPRNGQFVLSMEGAPDYYKFSIPGDKDIWEERIVFERKSGYKLYPSINRGLVNFRYVDMNNRPAPGEHFEAMNKRSGEVFRCTTNQYGIAQILLPLNEQYLFSTDYNPNFDELDVKLKEGFHIFEFEILYQSPTSAQWSKRFADIDALSALRDSIARLVTTEKEILPTEVKYGGNSNTDVSDRPIAMQGAKTFYIRKEVEKKAEVYRDSLKQNTRFFETHNKPILAALNRLRSSQKKKLIITDVTKSMAPYLEEVLVWHTLNLVKGHESHYIFFNDGDDKICSEKVIGKTGGIYECEGRLENLDSIIAKMQEATSSRMGGGEPPENNIESLLAGIAKNPDAQEIILVADAHSRVRDIKLLYKVKIPVRVILCGAEEQNRFYMKKKDINEEYLTIAYRTGGSVHTLSSDIVNLSQKADGDVIELQGIRYLLKNRQFMRI